MMTACLTHGTREAARTKETFGAPRPGGPGNPVGRRVRQWARRSRRGVRRGTDSTRARGVAPNGRGAGAVVVVPPPAQWPTRCCCPRARVASNTMEIHESFPQFFEAQVAPMLEEEPKRRRLDGRDDNESNPSTFALFRYAERRVWRIDADTHIAPLRIAYDAFIEGKLRSPFLEELNSKGKPSLILSRKLRGRLPGDAKHLYIYEELPTAGR